MALSEYNVTINGVKHVQRFDDKDAKRLGLKDSDRVKSGTAANKAGTAENKSK